MMMMIKLTDKVIKRAQKVNAKSVRLNEIFRLWYLESDWVAKSSLFGRETWSSGYGRRLMFWRSWVQIPALYTGWTFILCKFCNDVCLKRPKINDKRGRGWSIFKKVNFHLEFQTLPRQVLYILMDIGIINAISDSRSSFVVRYKRRLVIWWS